MRERLERLLTAILSVAAILMAVVVVHRELSGATRSASAGTDSAPTYVPTWRDMLPAGRVIGDTTAKVKIVTFSDLECPFCKGLYKEELELQRKNPAQVAIVFIHFPLPGHRFALPAARAAECANDLGRFEQFVEIAYEKQDSLGLVSWGSLADEAGIRDTVRFSQCTKASSNIHQVDIGMALGKSIGVRGTPTVVMNGWRFQRPPTPDELTQVLDALLHDRPVPWDSSRSAKHG